MHAQVDGGLRPRRHYTVNDALDDWLATGLDGLAPSTVTVYRNTIVKALREKLGTVKLTSLTAGTVQKALANLAARRSTRTVQMSHNVLVRAIRHAERDDLVGRNVAALVKPPKGRRAGHGVGTAGDAAHLRVAAAGSRCPGRGDRAAGRPQPDRHDRTGLPAPDRSGVDARRRSHGPDLQLVCA